MQKIVGIAVAFLILSVFFGVMERFFATLQRPRRDRKTFFTDLTYWFFTPIVTRSITRGTLFIAAVLIALVVGKEALVARVDNGSAMISALPKWGQVVAALLVGDFVGYWVHRAFHTSRLWKYHAVHHSPKILDWLAASRVHPVNDVVARACQAIPLIVIGFPKDILAAYVPFIGLYALFLHTNVPWDFGPLRGVLASPRFHRWHHTSEDEGQDSNFAGLLPAWDRLFGTYYMPDRQPEQFGVRDPVPDGLFGQLLYPFRASQKASEASSDGSAPPEDRVPVTP